MQCCPCAPHFISPWEGWNMLQLKVMCPISVQAGDKFIAPLTIYNPSESWWCGLCYLSCRGAATLMMLRLWGALKISKIQEEKIMCLLHTCICVVWVRDTLMPKHRGVHTLILLINLMNHWNGVVFCRGPFLGYESLSFFHLSMRCGGHRPIGAETHEDWSSCRKPTPAVGPQDQLCWPDPQLSIFMFNSKNKRG